MPNNQKKEYPTNGLEQDSVFARSIYKYLHNISGLTKYVKRAMSKRFRRAEKKIIQDSIDDYNNRYYEHDDIELGETVSCEFKCSKRDFDELTDWDRHGDKWADSFLFDE